MSLNDLVFPVEEQDVYVGDGNNVEQVPTLKAIVRSDTSTVLSIRSRHYKLVPNETFVNWLSEFSSVAGAHVMRCKLERGGARAHAWLTFGERKTRVGELSPMMRFTNSYDGTMSISAQTGIYRHVCSNGLVVPAINAVRRFRSIHKGAMLSMNIQQYIQACQSFVAHFDNVVEYYNLLDSTQIDEERARNIIKAVFGKRSVEDVVVLWKRGTGQTGNGTVWELYNGAVEWLEKRKMLESRRDMLNKQMFHALSATVK